MSTIRLKVTAPLESRDGTLAKDARMKNMIAEKKGDVIKAIKRPGIGNASAPVSGPAQGLIYMNGMIYGVVNDVLFGVAGSSSQQPQADWVKMSTALPFCEFSMLNRIFEINGKLFVTYGRYVYVSTNGADWTVYLTNSYYYAASKIGNRLFSYVDADLSNYIYGQSHSWRYWTLTADGGAWTQHGGGVGGTDDGAVFYTNGVPNYGNYGFPSTSSSGCEFNGAIHFFDGYLSGGDSISHITTYDGYSFYRENADCPIRYFPYNRVVVFDNKIWAVGVGDTAKEVWNSTNGTNWTQVTADCRVPFLTPISIFPPSLVVFGGELLIIGADAVYASTDGATWTAKNYKTRWSAREGTIVFVFGGDLFVIGGTLPGSRGVGFYEVWKLPASAAGGGGPSVMTRPL